MAASPFASESPVASGASAVCVGFEGDAPSNDLREVIARGVRAVILFARNVHDRAHVKQLVRDIKALSSEPVLVCVDQEGGETVRLVDGFEPPPWMRDIGEGGPAVAAQTGEKLGGILRDVGIDLNLAPVMDVDSNPGNPVIARRSFGAEPRHVGECGAALIRAMQACGVAACAKHFPGHGDTELDSHHELPVVGHTLARLKDIELPPFEAAVRAGVASIMTAHLRMDAFDLAVPATLSRRIVTDLLRGDLGFKGVVISDDLEMRGIAASFSPGEAAVAAVQAGVDLVLMCHTPGAQHEAIDALSAAIDSGVLAGETVRASAERRRVLWERYVR